MRITEKAANLAEAKGWELLFAKRLQHPDDYYLLYTLVQIEESDGSTSYATHLFNSELGENGSFNYGHYDFVTLAAAKKDLCERAGLCPKCGTTHLKGNGRDALSRKGNYYVCASCGVLEALEEAKDAGLI
jgi:hypothetical protein